MASTDAAGGRSGRKRRRTPAAPPSTPTKAARSGQLSLKQELDRAIKRMEKLTLQSRLPTRRSLMVAERILNPDGNGDTSRHGGRTSAHHVSRPVAPPNGDTSHYGFLTVSTVREAVPIVAGQHAIIVPEFSRNAAGTFGGFRKYIAADGSLVDWTGALGVPVACHVSTEDATAVTDLVAQEGFLAVETGAMGADVSPPVITAACCSTDQVPSNNTYTQSDYMSQAFQGGQVLDIPIGDAAGEHMSGGAKGLCFAVPKQDGEGYSSPATVVYGVGTQGIGNTFLSYAGSTPAMFPIISILNTDPTDTIEVLVTVKITFRAHYINPLRNTVNVGPGTEAGYDPNYALIGPMIMAQPHLAGAYSFGSWLREAGKKLYNVATDVVSFGSKALPLIAPLVAAL